MSYENLRTCCPRCSTDLNNELRYVNLLICPTCGWTDSSKEQKLAFHIELRFIKTAILFSLFAVISFIHTAEWDRYWAAVVPLQAKKLTGQAVPDDYLKLINICKERRNLSCVIDSYRSLLALEPNNEAASEAFGLLLNQKSMHEEAVKVYANYFSLGGKSAVAAYYFASSLVKTDRLPVAEKYFKYALDAKPDVIQITVARAYVDTLMKSKQYDLALKVIEDYRAKGESLFLENQYQEAKKFLAQF